VNGKKKKLVGIGISSDDRGGECGVSDDFDGFLSCLVDYLSN
jgi:hypothetical protein